MFEVKFADIGEGIHEGVIFKFEVEVGQEIEDGDTLFLVETDKVTAEIPSPVSGKVTQVHFKAGDTIHVGETIVTIDDGSGTVVDDVVHEVVSEQGSTSVVGDLEISSDVIASSSEVSSTPIKKPTGKVLATPVARKIAKDLGIDISSVKGTGPAGRVMKADIYAFGEETNKTTQKEVRKPIEKAPLQVNEDCVKRLPMTTIRKAISENMTKSKFTIPHTAVMDECQVDELVAYRQEAKLIARQKNVKLTYLPFIIKAVVVAIKEHEIMNASLDELNEEIVIKKDIHIGIAVDTPYGLMVPVIRHADQKSIIELALSIEDLSMRAQSKALTLDEISGSTFTITNYGAFGSSFGVPVINYPEAAILGIGMITKKPIVVEDAIEIGHLLPLSMSFDHRIIDGADAGRFMRTVKQLLNNPQLLLLS
jgi:pyruvate dehydrogenase E2 component (dihydrolipoamide acetyltransferase)